MKISVARNRFVVSNGTLVIDASDLRLPVGVFPETIYVFDGVCGETKEFNRALTSEEALTYRSDCENLKIFND